MPCLADRLKSKRVFVSSGTPEGWINLIDETGRVMLQAPLDRVEDADLALADQVCLNYADAHRLGIEFD